MPRVHCSMAVSCATSVADAELRSSAGTPTTSSGEEHDGEGPARHQPGQQAGPQGAEQRTWRRRRCGAGQPRCRAARPSAAAARGDRSGARRRAPAAARPGRAGVPPRANCRRRPPAAGSPAHLRRGHARPARQAAVQH
jgi:hypothetical protein